jgi:hypothetical protein
MVTQPSPSTMHICRLLARHTCRIIEMAGRTRAVWRAFSSASCVRAPAANLRVTPGDIRDGLFDAVGNTPLIRLRHLSEETGSEVCDEKVSVDTCSMTSTEVATDALSVFAPRFVQILAKAEWLNPGGSIKDRAAWGLITAAENSGALKPGGTVVEGVSSSQTVRLVGDAVPAPGRLAVDCGFPFQ